MGRPNLPDKIYFVIDEKGAHTFLGLQPDDAAEYIRKDALLEWAKERYKSTISNVGCYTGHSVWAEVIEKLESL